MMMSGWFGVRCVFTSAADDGGSLFEERITVWRAGDADAAIRLAEAEAEQYAADVDVRYLGLAQAYTMFDDLTAGAEVFSLVRTSSLEPTDYLDAFFATGAEHQTHVDP